MAKNSLWARARPPRRGGASLIVGAMCLSLVASACSSTPAATTSSHGNTVLNFWSTLTASDAQTWAKMIANFNKANNNKGLHEQIKLTTVANNYTTKVTAAVESGNAPNFGWGTAAEEALWAKQGVIIPLNDLARQAGFDLSDFTPASLKDAEYPSIGGNNFYLIPMDSSSFAMEINVAEAKAAGLNPADPPKTGPEFIHWLQALTVRSNGKVTRSGLVSDTTGLATTYWGIVAAQFGFQRVSPDLKTACINKQGGIDAMNWLVSLFDKYNVISRNISAPYTTFDTGAGAIMWEGPWTILGNNEAHLNWESAPLPVIGTQPATYFEDDGLEVYKQSNSSSYLATMKAIKWLSDNSFLWTTAGRGVTPRLSILHRSDYMTAGFAPKYRAAFIQSMPFADVASVPTLSTADFEYYSLGTFAVNEVSMVLEHKLSVGNFMNTVCAKWQSDLNSETG
jgi:multiple sugar transport system substrate-binding protein